MSTTANPTGAANSAIQQAASTNKVAIVFKSIGHFFAKAFSVLGKGITTAEGTEQAVETVTASIPGGAAIVPLEKMGYMVLGEIASVLTAGQSAAASKLADAGMDVNVVQQVEALLKQFPAIVTLAKSL